MAAHMSVVYTVPQNSSNVRNDMILQSVPVLHTGGTTPLDPVGNMYSYSYYGIELIDKYLTVFWRFSFKKPYILRKVSRIQ